MIRLSALLAFAWLMLAPLGNSQLVTGSTWGTTSTEESNPSLTSMELEKKHIVLGTLTKGTIFNYEIVFTNTGTEDLYLETVKPSCNCSTPEWSADPVKPGQKGTIKVAYNTTEKTPGNHEGTITIVYNGIPNVEQVTFEAVVVAAPEQEVPFPPHNE